MQCSEVSEYISRCVQSGAGLWLLYFFFPPLIPPLASLKWQFVKHGPLLALSLASQTFPARLLLLPPLSSRSPLRITRFTSFPHFPSFSHLSPLISIPPVHSASSAISLSLPVYLPLLVCVSLSFSFALPSWCDFSSSLSRRLFFSVHCCCCTLITSDISPSCTYFIIWGSQSLSYTYFT